MVALFELQTRVIDGMLNGIHKKPPEEKTLQDVFLQLVLDQKIAITIFLVNGVKMQGIILGFDNYSLLLDRNSQAQMLYKHAIATIMLPIGTDSSRLGEP